MVSAFKVFKIRGGTLLKGLFLLYYIIVEKLNNIDNLNVVEPISAYHKECPTCGAKLFPVVHENIDKNDPEESKADKVCHCCGKKFMVLFGC